MDRPEEASCQMYRAGTTQELELQTAELLPGRETPLM
jgi:hypothetical protein